MTLKRCLHLKLSERFLSLLLKSAVTINAPSLISDEENLNARLRFSTLIKAHNDAKFRCLLDHRFGL